MKLSFEGLWAEAYQSVHQSVVAKIILHEQTASILNVVLTAFSLIGFFFHRFFSQLFESSKVEISSSLKSEQIPEERKAILERLERNRIDAENQQKSQVSTDFEFMYTAIPDAFIFKDHESSLTSHSPKIEGFSVGSAACQGARDSMEDEELAMEGTYATTHAQYPFKLFGIFDGHSRDGIAGAKASKFVKDNFPTTLLKQLELHCKDNLNEEGIFKSLKESCQIVDAAYQGEGGATGTVAFIIDNSLWVANVGDSRTIFIKQDGTIVQASEDAKPTDETYAAKIHRLGGEVIKGRVNNKKLANDSLGVARAFGDHDIHGHPDICCISSNPKITKFLLIDIIYIILACDGLYDVASTDNIGKAIQEMDIFEIEDVDGNKIKDRDGNNILMAPDEMAKRLIQTAIRMETKDNVSVIVVKNNAVK